MISLDDLAGGKYKMTYEESYTAHRTAENRLWCRMIVCKHGTIFLYDNNMLGFSSYKLSGRVKKVLLSLAEKGLRITQDGDDGFNCCFPADLFKEVCRIVKPKHKRTMSAENIEKAKARLSAYHKRNLM